MTSDSASDGSALEIGVPRRLSSPNADRGHHWSRRHRVRNAWELELLVALPRGWKAWSLIEDTAMRRDRLGLWRISEHRRRERRRVSIVREVPHRRNLLKDDDNQAFCTKGLLDCLKALGLVYDDSTAWMERVFAQEVTGRDFTRIRIERLA